MSEVADLMREHRQAMRQLQDEAMTKLSENCDKHTLAIQSNIEASQSLRDLAKKLVAEKTA